MAQEPQLLSLLAATSEAWAPQRRCSPQQDSMPCLRQLEKPQAQQWKLSTAKNKLIKKDIPQIIYFSQFFNVIVNQ